jgi:hypothetical protein
MINLELLRLELNYFRQVIKDILGDKVSAEINEAIITLVTSFLSLNAYESSSLSCIQTIEQYLNLIQKEIEPHDFRFLINNTPTIKFLIDKVKFELPIC